MRFQLAQVLESHFLCMLHAGHSHRPTRDKHFYTKSHQDRVLRSFFRHVIGFAILLMPDRPLRFEETLVLVKFFAPKTWV